MKHCGLIFVAGLIFGAASTLRAAPAVAAGMIEIRGAIGPATASYISRAIKVAARENDVCLIIQLDTPGGLLDSTKKITQIFYASPVPIVVYVAPSGSSATSAGCFITMAADFAVMAPHTSIGAAHPVGMAGEGQTNEIMSIKAENFAASLIEAIAERRGRNVEWARSAVRESASITAEKAVELKVVDFIAKDVPDLLTQLDGRELNGRTLKTAGASVTPIPISWGENLFQMLWNPEVMMLLMLVAITGIIGEINHPGAILPGVAGAIALVLFLYMATVIPVNVAGVALILLAVALFIVDVYAPTHGVLTVGGAVAFFLGALMLFNRSAPGFHLSLGYIVPATVVITLFFLFIAGAGLRAQRLPVRAGSETMLGRVVPALERIDAQGGRVFVEGEYWTAVSDVPVEKGQPVEVTGIEGLKLKVKPTNRPT